MTPADTLALEALKRRLMLAYEWRKNPSLTPDEVRLLLLALHVPGEWVKRP